MLFTDEQLAKGTANRLDGLSEEEEENYRRKTNEFVLELCVKLDMNPRSKWYACTLTHRFFAYESFKRRDRLLVAATAVFLGGKMAENARRLLDVVGFYYSLRNKTPRPPEKSKLVQDLKEEVLAYERLMLHVIGFDLYIEIPRAKFGELGGKVKGTSVCWEMVARNDALDPPSSSHPSRIHPPHFHSPRPRGLHGAGALGGRPAGRLVQQDHLVPPV